MIFKKFLDEINVGAVISGITIFYTHNKTGFLFSINVFWVIQSDSEVRFFART